MSNNFKRETLCVQAGWQPKNGEPRVLPIYQSTTFKYETSEEMAKLFDLEKSGFFYTRLQNPTNEAVAAKIAALEGGVAAMLTSSGQAANFFAFFNICEAGDKTPARRRSPRRSARTRNCSSVRHCRTQASWYSISRSSHGLPTNRVCLSLLIIPSRHRSIAARSNGAPIS